MAPKWDPSSGRVCGWNVSATETLYGNQVDVLPVLLKLLFPKWLNASINRGCQARSFWRSESPDA